MQLTETQIRKIIREEIKSVMNEQRGGLLSLSDLKNDFSRYFGNDSTIHDGSRFIYITETTRSGYGLNKKGLQELMKLPGFKSIWIKSSDDTIEYSFFKDEAIK